METDRIDRIYEEFSDIGHEAIRDLMERGKNNYGDAFMELGARGQYSEIHRKVAKLKRAIWDGVVLEGETPEQVAKEIIPHLLMMVWCLERERKQPVPVVTIPAIASDDFVAGVKYAMSQLQYGRKIQFDA